MRFGRTGGERALRPVRWPGRPGGGTLLRVGLVAALLGLAAALLHAPPGGAPDGGGPATRAPTVTTAGRSAPPGSGPTGSDPSGSAASGSGPTGSAPSAVDRAGGDPAVGRPDPAVPQARSPGRTDPVGEPSGGPTLPLPDGTVGVPVRLAEPAALAVVRPGNRVDLLAVPTGATTAVLVAPRALVLAVIGAGELDGSAALYLALPPAQAERAVAQPEGSRFAVLVRG